MTSKIFIEKMCFELSILTIRNGLGQKHFYCKIAFFYVLIDDDVSVKHFESASERHLSETL